MTAPSYDVTAIGNAIVDVIQTVDDAFIEAQGLGKGTMTLIDLATVQKLLAQTSPGARYRSGGSAANTMAGIASFGGRCAYIGKTANDAAGQKFATEIQALGVAFNTPPDTETGLPTAQCFSFVTPDAERTMATYLGISTELAPDDLDPFKIRDARVTYLEGYLFDKPIAKDAFNAAAMMAHMAGREVALTLSDPFCVTRHRSDFLQLIDGHVDIVFANEQELLTLYETDDFVMALDRLSANVGVCAVTRGVNGAVIVVNGVRYEIPAAPVANIVDTTGAGDLFAAGFLYGYTRDMDPYACGLLGAKAAAEIIGHIGARPERSLAELLP